MSSEHGVKYGQGRLALLRATVEVAASLGLDKLSYRKISEYAGVSNPLINHYFANREELLKATAEWSAEKSARATIAILEEGFGEEQAENLLEFIRQEAQIQLFQYQIILKSAIDSNYKKMAQALYSVYIDTFQKSLGTAGYPSHRAFAQMIFAAFDGLILQQITIATDQEIKAAIGELIKILQTLKEE